MLRQLRFLLILVSLLIVSTFHGLVDAKQAIIDVDVINVRSGPGTEYDLVHKLSKNAVYPIIEEKDRWYKITYDTNKTGWIASWLVTVQESLTPQPTNPTNTIPNTNQANTSGNTATKTQVAESTIETLNVRSGPSTSFSIVKTIRPKEFYPVITDNGEWVELQLTDQLRGWVTKQLVRITTKNIDSSIKATSVTVTVGILNVRAEPNTSSTILDKLTQGQNVELLEVKDGWYKIRTNATTGWIASEYTKQNTQEQAKPPSTAETVQQPTDSSGTEQQGTNAQEKPTNALKQATVNVSVLNIRSGPGATYDSLGKLKEHDIVTIIDQQNEWLKIDLGSTQGWISSEFVTIQKGSASVSQVPKVIVTTNGINIRSGPGTNFDIVTSANEGDTFKIINTDGDWYQIELPNSKTGYIASWIVQTEGIANKENDRSISGILKGKTIVVDAGHGGIDSGVIGSYYKTLEKDVALPTALLLESKLKAAGANVIMTRSKDIYLNLQQRVAVSVNHKADAFISIHYNQNNDSSINGTIVYHYTANGEDAKLAKIMQQEMVQRNGMKNMGARQDNFYVLRENPQLAVLVEVAFLSNKSDELTSKSSSFQEKSAEGMFQGLLKYFNQQ